VAHLFWHRVEALARHSQIVTTDLLTQLTLRALASERFPDIDRLTGRLLLGRPLVHRLLHRLEQDGLVSTEKGSWTPSPLGRQALADGHFLLPEHRRRTFHFLDLGPGRQPQFVDLKVAARSWSHGTDWHFDIATLRDCLARPDDWKCRHGFPADVDAITTLDDALPSNGGPLPAGSWQPVVLDRAERLPVVLVLRASDSGQPRLHGFTFQEEGWVLQAMDPAFVLPDDLPEFMTLLTADQSEAWRQAWRDWGTSRGLPVSTVDECSVALADTRLSVRAPRSVFDRLRSARSEVLKGEVCLMAGDGPIRPAAVLEVTPV
jgi:hypothetical protein